LRLDAQAESMLAGTQAGGDVRAFQQIVAAPRVASNAETVGSLLAGLIARPNTLKIIPTPNTVTSVAVSPDGRRIVSGSWDNTLRLWNPNTGQQIGTPVIGHSGWVSSVAINPDRHRIVSGSDDTTLRFWDAETTRPLGPPLSGHTSAVNSVAFNPDGHVIVSGSTNRTLRLWPGPAAWPDLLCDKLTGNMSRKQWRDWVSQNIGYITVCPGLPILSDS
jgi:WD40 repeat protein